MGNRWGSRLKIDRFPLKQVQGVEKGWVGSRGDLGLYIRNRKAVFLLFAASVGKSDLRSAGCVLES